MSLDRNAKAPSSPCSVELEWTLFKTAVMFLLVLSNSRTAARMLSLMVYDVFMGAPGQKTIPPPSAFFFFDRDQTLLTASASIELWMASKKLRSTTFDILGCSCAWLWRSATQTEAACSQNEEWGGDCPIPHRLLVPPEYAISTPFPSHSHSCPPICLTDSARGSPQSWWDTRTHGVRTRDDRIVCR